MSQELPPLVLVCACGQKMKIPADAHGKAFKCVRCGARITADDANARAGAAEAVPAARAPERVGQLLIEDGLISQEQLDHALGVQCEQGGKTFEILMALGYLDKEALHAFLSRQQGVATIDLSRFSIDRDLVRLIPKKMALEQFVLPIDRLGKLLTVAMACPLDSATIAEMEKATQLKVKAVLCKLDDLKAAVEKYYRDPNDPLDAEGFAVFGSLPTRIRFDAAEPIERLEALPVAPESAARLVVAAKDHGALAPDLVEAAAEDPALALALLRAANSAAYGMAGDVDNLALAVALLGREGVQRLASDVPQSPEDVDPAEAIRARGRAVAQAARAIAKTGGSIAPGVAFTVGLIHGAGSLALQAVAPEKYRYVDAKLSSAALRDAEGKAFTMAHPEAGASLAGHWGLPARVAEALRCQANPVAAADDAAALATVVAAAVALVDAGDAASEDSLGGLREALAAAGYTVDAVLEAARAA